MSEHVHDWQRTEGFVIATFPPQYPYECECGAFTHNPETGKPCQTCAPGDYARRGPTVLLRGGPLGGKRITLPVNRTVKLRVDPEGKRVQKYVTYKKVDGEVWEFHSNDWTHAFEERVDV